MFLNVPKTVEYRDPWTSSLEERLSRLTAKSRRIAYFYEHPDTSTFRYRAFNPGYTLAAQSCDDVSAAWFDSRDLSETDRFIEWADALVLCRARYSARIASMINRATQRHIPVIFDCDDLVFDVNRLHMIVDTLNLNQFDDAMWNDWFAMVGRLGATLRMCSTFMTTNRFLADRALDFKPGIKTSIVPNYLNKNQQELSELCFARKQESGWARDERIHIGYFSGSPTHAKDFSVVAPSIAKLMAEDSRIVLRVVGFPNIQNELNDFQDRIEIYPLQDFMNLQRLIAEVEINIAPLRENVFTNCKSELKFFEAAICGTLTVASPTYCFKATIDHGRTGYLASALNWYDTLQNAVDLVTAPKEYEEIAVAARNYAQQHYSWHTHGDTIKNAVFLD